MTKKKANEQPPAEPDEIPATQGGIGEQGGTSQPGPPTDPNDDSPRTVDFANPSGDKK